VVAAIEGIRATIDVVDLLVSFRKVALGLFELFLLISPLADLSTSSMKPWSWSQLGLVLSLGMENADAI
jgi:hypothetical protein